jgi:hypothetical protein
MANLKYLGQALISEAYALLERLWGSVLHQAIKLWAVYAYKHKQPMFITPYSS